LLKSARLNEDSEHAVSAYCGSENVISNLVSQIGTPPRTKHLIRIVLAQEFVGARKAGRVLLNRGNLKSKSGSFTDEISVRIHTFSLMWGVGTVAAPPLLLLGLVTSEERG
jgi:hypothetical protein